MVTAPGGRLCRCGVRGCWETEVGALAIAEAVGWRGVSVRELGRHVRMVVGGPHEAGLHEVAVAVGRGVGTLVNLLNPRAVVLGGLLGDVHATVADTLADAVRSVALAACLEQVDLVTAECGEDAVLVGAAETLWESLLADPVATLGAAL